MTTAQYNKARLRHQEELDRGVVTGARMDRYSGRLVIEWSNLPEMILDPRMIEGLESANPKELTDVEVVSEGMYLYFPRIDKIIYAMPLRDGIYGSKAWMKAHAGLLL